MGKFLEEYPPPPKSNGAWWADLENSASTPLCLDKGLQPFPSYSGGLSYPLSAGGVTGQPLWHGKGQIVKPLQEKPDLLSSSKPTAPIGDLISNEAISNSKPVAGCNLLAKYKCPWPASLVPLLPGQIFPLKIACK